MLSVCVCVLNVCVRAVVITFYGPSLFCACFLCKCEYVCAYVLSVCMGLSMALIFCMCICV